MAGDWIKIQSVTPDKPEVFAIAEQLGLDPDTVVGKLVRIWIWADQQTLDGRVKISNSVIDRVAMLPGFAQALRDIGWLSDEGFANFDRHNGNSAKARASGAQRVATHRAKESKDGNADVTKSCYSRVTLPRPIRRKIFERDKNTCVYCGRKEGEKGLGDTDHDARIHVDHVIPVTRGGTSDELNLVTACGSCNQYKTNKTPDECGLEWPVNPVTGKRYGSVTDALQDRYKSVTREEKRREENNNTHTHGRGRCSNLFIPENLSQSSAFMEAFDAWIENLFTLTGIVNRPQLETHLVELSRMGAGRAVEVIRYSIGKGGKYLYTDAPDANGKKPEAARKKVRPILPNREAS